MFSLVIIHVIIFYSCINFINICVVGFIYILLLTNLFGLLNLQKNSKKKIRYELISLSHFTFGMNRTIFRIYVLHPCGC